MFCVGVYCEGFNHSLDCGDEKTMQGGCLFNVREDRKHAHQSAKRPQPSIHAAEQLVLASGCCVYVCFCCVCCCCLLCMRLCLVCPLLPPGACVMQLLLLTQRPDRVI
jgi:hypothetical protein